MEWDLDCSRQRPQQPEPHTHAPRAPHTPQVRRPGAAESEAKEGGEEGERQGGLLNVSFVPGPHVFSVTEFHY